jgi:hypothetical protein
MVGDEEGVIIRQIGTFQMDQSLENGIRERAYEIWTAHGCVHGKPISIGLQPSGKS